MYISSQITVFQFHVWRFCLLARSLSIKRIVCLKDTMNCCMHSTIQWNLSNQTSKRTTRKKSSHCLDEKDSFEMPIWCHMTSSFRFGTDFQWTQWPRSPDNSSVEVTQMISYDILLGRGVWRLGSHSTSSSGMARGWGRLGVFFRWRWYVLVCFMPVSWLLEGVFFIYFFYWTTNHSASFFSWWWVWDP